MEVNYIIMLVIALALVVYLAYMYKVQGREKAVEEARRITMRMMLIAEKRFGTNNGTGALKMNWVAERIRLILPPYLSGIITDDNIEEFLESTYLLGKDYLDDGKINNSHKPS